MGVTMPLLSATEFMNVSKLKFVTDIKKEQFKIPFTSVLE